MSDAQVQALAARLRRASLFYAVQAAPASVLALRFGITIEDATRLLEALQ